MTRLARNAVQAGTTDGSQQHLRGAQLSLLLLRTLKLARKSPAKQAASDMKARL